MKKRIAIYKEQVLGNPEVQLKIGNQTFPIQHDPKLADWTIEMLEKAFNGIDIEPTVIEDKNFYDKRFTKTM